MEIKQTKTNTSSDGNLKKNWILSKCHFKMQVLNHNTNTSSDGKTNWENQIRLILQKIGKIKQGLILRFVNFWKT